MGLWPHFPHTQHHSPTVPAAAAACRAHSPCTGTPLRALTQLAGGPHPLLGADALKAVHLVHAGAPCCTRVGGTLVDVCRGTEGLAWGGRPCRQAGPQERWGPLGTGGHMLGSSCCSSDPWIHNRMCRQPHCPHPHTATPPPPSRPPQRPGRSTPMLERALTQCTSGPIPARWAVAFESGGHLMA